MPDRPRLTPAIADIRRAVRTSIGDLVGSTTNASLPNAGADVAHGARVAPGSASAASAPAFGTRAGEEGRPALVLVALSGGPDSLALAAAVAFEAPRVGVAAGAVIVDHGLQPGSDAVAARAAEQAATLGLSPVRIERVTVGADGGPEAAARDARYA